MMTHVQHENPDFHKHGEELRADSQQEQGLGPLARRVGFLGNSSRGETTAEPGLRAGKQSDTVPALSP